MAHGAGQGGEAGSSPQASTKPARLVPLEDAEALERVNIPRADGLVVAAGEDATTGDGEGADGACHGGRARAARVRGEASAGALFCGKSPWRLGTGAARGRARGAMLHEQGFAPLCPLRTPRFWNVVVSQTPTLLS